MARIRPLRQLLDRLFFRLSDSDSEIYFRRVVTGSFGTPAVTGRT